MDVIGTILSAGSRLIGDDPNQYCDQFNVTYQHRVDNPGTQLHLKLNSTSPHIRPTLSVCKPVCTSI